MPVKEPPYDIGDDLRLAAAFTDEANHLVNPTTATLKIVCPDGATITKTGGQLTHPSVGVYQYVYTVANGWGIYHVTWTGAGAFGIIEQDSFRVRKPAG